MPVPLTRADLHQALQDGELLDIDEDDLQALLLRAEEIAQRRQFSGWTLSADTGTSFSVGATSGIQVSSEPWA